MIYPQQKNNLSTLADIWFMYTDINLLLI